MGFGWKSPSGPVSDADGKHQFGSSNANGSTSSGGTAGALGRGLAVVPEKAAMGHSIRSTVPAQYWGAHVASATAPDGAVFTAVADPAPLPLLSGSGISRPHLVLATQAVSLPGRPSLPGLPSLCQEQGGAVLDRVLVHGSGDSWWAVLSGRAKLGKMAAERGNPVAALMDPGSYSLCANTRMAVGSAVLRTRADWCPNPRGSAAAEAPLSLSAVLRSNLGSGAEARADLAVQQRAATCPHAGGAGQAQQPAAVTPLLLGVQAGSTASHRAPLAWRCGVLQVTAPPTVPLAGASEDAMAGGSRAWPQAMQTAVYMQGTAALQGEHTLYQAPRKSKRRTSPAAATTAEAPGSGAGAASTPAGSSAATAVRQVSPSPPTPQPVRPVTAGPPAAAAGATASTTNTSRLHAHRPPAYASDGDDSDSEDVGHFSRAATEQRRQQAEDSRNNPTGSSTSGGSRGAPARPGPASAVVGSRIGSTAGPAGSPVSGAGGSGSAGSSSGGSGSPPFGVELPTAGKVQDALSDATQAFSRVRDEVTQATRWVGEGGLVEQLEGMGKPGGKAKRPAAPARHGPWSAFVGVPHIKVAGVVGLAARTPVLRVVGRAPLAAVQPEPSAGAGTGAGVHGNSSSGGPAGAAAATQAQGSLQLGDEGFELQAGVGGQGEGEVVLQQQPHLRPTHAPRAVWVQDFGLGQLWRRVRAAAGGGGAAAERLREASGGVAGREAAGAVRPFASGAVSVQAGRFCGWLLDFTRVTAKLDMGLWGPAIRGHVLGSGTDASPPRRRHPAFALDDTGAWHALTLSLSQQLLGPLRLCADWRYELSSSHALTLPPLPHAHSPAASSGGGASGAAAAGGLLSRAAGWVPDASACVARHVSGMRPQLLDSAVALDLVLPGSEGAARLVAWYSPQRREGMLELRLF